MLRDWESLFVSIHDYHYSSYDAVFILCVFKTRSQHPLLIEVSCYPPEIQKQADIRKKAGGGGAPKVAFNAIDEKIDNMIRTALFSRYKSNPCREINKE